MEIIIESGRCGDDFIEDLGEYERNLLLLYIKKSNYKIECITINGKEGINTRAVAFTKTYKVGKIGGIGMLRIGKSYEEFQSLINKAELWFRNENIVKYYIPIDFNTFYRYRIISNHLKNPPFLLERKSNPYIAELIGKSNFIEEKKYYSYIVKDLYSVIYRLENFALRAKSENIEIVEEDVFKPNKNLLKELYEITDDAFADSFLYEKIDFNEFNNLYKPLINNSLGVKLLLAKINNKNVGYLFAVNDKYKENRWVVKTIAVKKAYLSLGVGTLLTYELYRRAIRLGIKELIHAYMNEGISTRRFSKTFGEIYREYTLYGKEIK